MNDNISKASPADMARLNLLAAELEEFPVTEIGSGMKDDELKDFVCDIEVALDGLAGTVRERMETLASGNCQPEVQELFAEAGTEVQQ